MELSCEKNQRLKHVDYFCKKAPLQMIGWTSNVPLIEGVGIGSRRLVYSELDEARSN